MAQLVAEHTWWGKYLESRGYATLPNHQFMFWNILMENVMIFGTNRYASSKQRIVENSQKNLAGLTICVL